MPRMKPIVYSGIMSMFALLAVAADQAESPIYRSWAGAKIGTSVTHREVVVTKGVRVETTRKQTLTKRTDSKVVIDEEQFGVGASGEPEVLTSLSLDYNKALFLLPGMTREKIEKPGIDGKGGEETIKVAGKEYKAYWCETVAPTDHGPATARTWISGEVPGKVLRTSMKVPSADKIVTTELIEVSVP